MPDQATSSLDRPAITRRRTRVALIGGIPVGGGHPIVVQSMTNTDTADIAATVAQTKALADAGSELVRITVNTAEAAAAVPVIRERLDALDCKVPLIGDFHFNGHKLLSNFPDCARALAKYRINPGNVGKGTKHDPQFAVMIERAIDYGKPVRIGVNWGSLDQDLLTSLMDQNAKSANPLDAAQVTREALVTSALRSAQSAEALGLPGDRIVLSCKVSNVQDLIAVYTELARRCDYPLHLGLTEAGMGSKGIVASTAALAVLLQQGIGDTIRISLTPKPDGDRTREVIVAQEILQTMGLRSFAPLVSACPGCGRTSSVFFQELAAKIQTYLRAQMPVWREHYPGVESMSVAVMGCVVNGPGESKMANIGISLPGTGEMPVAPVFVDGQKTVTLKGERIAEEFEQIVADYVRATYGGEPRAPHLNPERKSAGIPGPRSATSSTTDPFAYRVVISTGGAPCRSALSTRLVTRRRNAIARSGNCTGSPRAKRTSCPARCWRSTTVATMSLGSCVSSGASRPSRAKSRNWLMIRSIASMSSTMPCRASSSCVSTSMPRRSRASGVRRSCETPARSSARSSSIRRRLESISLNPRLRLTISDGPFSGRGGGDMPRPTLATASLS